MTDGVAVLIEREGSLEARVTELTEPGVFLNAACGRGMRVFRLTLADGRTGAAELVATSWQTPGRRVCRFAWRPLGESAAQP
ncbi:MAG: hypothetical protein U0837_18640 [Dehalococcoidia bacterium]